MAVAVVNRKEAHIFTVELMVSLGADDNHETRDTVHTFNNLIRFWSQESKTRMEAFVNRVKSRVDHLALALDHTNPSDGRIQKTQGDDVRLKELESKLLESETKLKHSQTSLRTLHAKMNQLKHKVPETHDLMLNQVLSAYKSKCKELVSLHDEYSRFSIWFNEKLRVSAAEVQQSNKRASEIERDIRELKQQNEQRTKEDTEVCRSGWYHAD
jgi:hypothetical protein